MIGTLFSLLIAVFIYLSPIPEDAISQSAIFPVILFSVGIMFIIIQTLITIFAWGPLQKAEQNVTPRVMQAFKQDRHLRITTALLMVFLVFTYFVALDLFYTHKINPTYLIMGWTILLGISVDFVHHLLVRVMSYLDPFHVIDYLGDSALTSVRKSNFQETCDWIDTFSETSMKAISRNSTSLALMALDKNREIAKTYLEVAKSISFQEEDQEGKGNHVNYTLFYLFQRLEMVFDKAARNKLEPICSTLITLLGKVAIYCAKYDVSAAHYPLHYVGKFALDAQNRGMTEVGNRATLTLLEVSKVIINEADMQYIAIKELFLTVVDNMDEIAKETFRNDKEINIALLTQPFFDLKELFLQEKVASHQDTPIIVQSIDRVINEFTTLETVLNTLPPIPAMKKEKEKIDKVADEPQESEES